jgi:hypothetical protein
LVRWPAEPLGLAIEDVVHLQRGRQHARALLDGRLRHAVQLAEVGDVLARGQALATPRASAAARQRAAHGNGFARGIHAIDQHGRHRAASGV